MENVSRSQSMVSLLASALVLGAAVLLGSLFMPSSAHASAPNGFTSKTFQDSDTDGDIDRVVVVVNGGEVLSACTVDATELGTDWTYTGNTYGGSISSATCVTATATVTITLTGTTADTTGGGTLPTLGYDNDDADNSIANASGNLGTVAAAALTDGAGPVLVSASPTNLKTGVRETASITLTYSETPASWTGSITGSVTLSSSINSTVVTLTHTARLLTGQNTLTISTSPDSASNAFAGAQTGDTTVASPLIFYVSSSSGDEEEEETETTYSVNLLTPEDGDSIEAGSATEITWESDGGQASYVNLSYSEDGGTTWETIVTNTLNDGSYNWTAPQIDSDEVLVKIVTTDLALELATDTSDEFSVWYYADEDTSEGEEEGAEDDADEEIVDEIDGIMAGDYIKLEGGSTIYYVDSSMMRRPFSDEATYFTYEDDFDAVVEVSADTMAEFSIGAPMLPKAGVVLVKIQSVAKVYMVEEAADGSYELRWITSEDVAEEMFGSSWSSYVVDVDATLFTRYETGDDLDEAEDIDTDVMEYREDLHD